MPHLNKESLKKILEDIGKVKIAVIGDFCLDAYWFIDESLSEISIETSLATRPVSSQRYSLGGAGNVTANLSAMGVRDVRAFGVIGSDPFGTEMIRLMEITGINSRNLLIQDENWNTHTYAKPYLNESELNRVDFGNFNKLSDKTADQLLDNLKHEIQEIDLIIINQQVVSGIHTEYFKKELADVIHRSPDKIFLTDSRNFNDFYRHTIHKMNDIEAARLCGITRIPEEDIPVSELKSYAANLAERFRMPLFITCGRKGSVVADQTGIVEIPGLMITARVDTVGAGDSYLAGCASALAAGCDLETAGFMGTFVAGVTVQKLFQTGTASPREIQEIGSDPDFIYNPDLAFDIRNADYMTGTEIEIINKLKNKPEILYVIFDHDGTVSTLRQGWEKIMTPMMTKCILGDKYYNVPKQVFEKVSSQVDEFVDKTTGIQTLIQMKGLVGMVREFGFVSEKEILNESEYKEIYNRDLLAMVNKRIAKLEHDELSQEDFTIKNVVPFITKLHEAGIRLYLVSGTDVEDVRREARILGYDTLFEGGIYGAVGDIQKEAKKEVLERILDMLGGEAAGTIATFGDGPVEIRETRKRGGICIGVASDEIRRFGLNRHKRTRLISAGADIIVPDFTQTSFLLTFLNIG